jgi:hypothetical protein
MYLDAHVTPSFPTNTLMKGIRLKTKALQAKLLTKIRKRHDGEEEEEEEGGGKNTATITPNIELLELP